MAKKRGLNKGLDALLGGAVLSSEPAKEVTIDPGSAVEESDGLRHLPVEFLQPGKFQPRRDMHQQALEELAQSIRAQGVMQPIVVRPLTKNNYEIIAGERRWRAAQMAQLDVIPCVIRDVPDEAAIAMALIENIQRENLNPMEEAIALDRLKTELGLTHQLVAEAVGKSRTTVTNLLRLMSLNDGVKTMLEHGDLEMGHSRALLSLPIEEQIGAAKTVVSRALSVRQTEALVRKLLDTSKSEDKQKEMDPNVKSLTDSLVDKLGAPVQLKYNSKGKGKLVVNFNSLDELDGILAHIQ